MSNSITETFRDGTVLVTGFTGFLGKLLVEKLLRSCPIQNIAVIVRSKKGRTAQQRVQCIFEDALFERLRGDKPEFMQRIKVLEGCLEDPLLGLSLIDRDWLIANVNFFFHCAATTRFNETLKQADKINIQVTEQLLLLSTKMKNLKGVVHVSTAYSHYPRNEISEEYYPVSITGYNELKSLLGSNKSQADILGEWPNTYTFTKAITENMLMKNYNHLPISIFRPSISKCQSTEIIFMKFGCTKTEPQPGWVNSINGPICILMPLIIGKLRVIPLSINKIFDLVPADYTVNALICVMWSTVNRYLDANKLLEEPKIFNYVSGVESPIIYNDFFKGILKNYRVAPPLTSLWYYYVRFTENVWSRIMLRFVLHWIPAIFMDLSLMLIGKKPKMLKMYAKLERMTDLLYKITSREWKFSNRNTRELWSLLCHEDRMNFWFSFEEFDWKPYIKSYYNGIRKFILREDQSNIDEAIAKNRRLLWFHYLIVPSIVLLVLQVFWLF